MASLEERARGHPHPRTVLGATRLQWRLFLSDQITAISNLRPRGAPSWTHLLRPPGLRWSCLEVPVGLTTYSAGDRPPWERSAY